MRGIRSLIDSPPCEFGCVADEGTGGEVANALVCKTSIHGFNSHPVLQIIMAVTLTQRLVPFRFDSRLFCSLRLEVTRLEVAWGDQPCLWKENFPGRIEGH